MSMGMVNKDTAATIPAAGNTGDKVGNLAELHTTSKSDIVAAVNEVKDEQANKADKDIVADAFSAAETYAEGDYCTYEGGLYKFKTAHEGAWDAADVDRIKIAGELSELKNTLNYLGLTEVESGDANCSIGTPKVDNSVSFGKTHSAAPNIVLAMPSNPQISVGTTSYTKTGFILSALYADGSSTARIRWIAIWV